MPRSAPAAIAAPLDIDALCLRLAGPGYAVTPGFLPAATVGALEAECRLLDACGEFASAGVGRGEHQPARTGVRGDRIRWLHDEPAVPAEAALRLAFDALRAAVNASLFLGLFDLEAHYAIYPPGAGYARHRDRFADERGAERVLSCVLYLNADWTPADGGELRLHLEGETRDVPPAAGTLVTFLSDRVEHEVLPAKRERYSISGWFRRRP